MIHKHTTTSPYCIAFWFDRKTMAAIYYKTKEERDKCMRRLEETGKLKIEWDYAPADKATDIEPDKFFAFDIIGDTYDNHDYEQKAIQ